MSLLLGLPAMAGWDAVKNAAVPVTGLPAEYDAAYRQPCASLGWDDGVHISRDGLYLYCTYVPGDFLSWSINSGNPFSFGPYRRGETFGMDLTLGDSSWVHSDILYAARSSVDDPFTTWQLSDMARPLYSEGAPQTVGGTAGGYDLFVFTSICSTAPPNYHTDLWWISGSARNPSGTGMPLPVPVNTDSAEDNPHMERIDDSTLVLFFESGNRAGGPGGLDIWHTLSTDNGTTWTDPRPVTSLDTERDEEQPHLYRDSTGPWYLYYTVVPESGLEAIYRARQSVPGNWDSWTDPELVIGSDGTFSVGEPSLTANGDISFVVGYINPDGVSTDRYDVDPWFLPRKKPAGIGWNEVRFAPHCPSDINRIPFRFDITGKPWMPGRSGLYFLYKGKNRVRKNLYIR